MKGKRISPREYKARLEVDENHRSQCFRDLLKHIEDGYGISCYEKISHLEIQDMIKRFPNEFDEEALFESMRKANMFWEDIGKRQANGTCMGNSRSWYYNMVNKYGWREKVEVEATHKGAISVNIVSYSPDPTE